MAKAGHLGWGTISNNDIRSEVPISRTAMAHKNRESTDEKITIFKKSPSGVIVANLLMRCRF
jgi:hypothetical protein